MNNPFSSILCFTFLFTYSPVSSFNITRLLNQFPEFGAFNELLTKTHLFQQINNRQTITVLAMDNATVSALAGNSIDVIKQILSVHVILDYYDISKFRNLPAGKATVLTTLFQSTGDAVNRQGFVKVVLNNRGQIEFRSAAKGAPLAAKFERMVASLPYNISVLQISSPIVVPGIGVYHLPPPAPAPLVEVVEVPAPAPADDESLADGPSPASDDAPADAPDAPASAPPEAADDDADGTSAASRGDIAGAGVVAAGLVSLCLVF